MGRRCTLKRDYLAGRPCRFMEGHRGECLPDPVQPESRDKAAALALETVDANTVHAKVLAKMAEAERKAWLSLAGYKFLMFGYWAAQWVLCKSLLPEHVRNPFATLVRFAADHVDREGMDKP